jgi:hypothetical protein
MARLVTFLRETLDLTIVYLALIGVALPFVVLFWLLFAPKGFLLAVVLLGIALAIFLLPVFERNIRVFSTIISHVPSPVSTLTFSFAIEMLRGHEVGEVYKVDNKLVAFALQQDPGSECISRTQHMISPANSFVIRNSRSSYASSLMINSKISGGYDHSFNHGPSSAQNNVAHAI